MEMIAAVVVLGILAALSVKPLNGMVQRIRLQNAADGMKHYVLNARMRAVANPDRHCGVVFRIHGAGGADDSIFAFLDSNPPDKHYVKGQDSLYLAPMVIPRNQGILADIPSGFPTELVFRADGSASASAQVELTLKSFSDTLDVLASTGRVKVIKK
jgi:Tfp pilus assembly protein FimT